ncbi:hypothetical protein D3C75_311120 [compost metagenome]
MSPRNSIVIWLMELTLLCAIYSLLCAFMPDVYLYDVYTDKFGFLTEAEWYDRYIFALSILSLLLTTLLIWLIARFLHR